MGGTFGPLLLIGSMLLLVALGVPIAYAIGIASLITALYVGIPLEAILLKVSDGVDNFALLAIPFFVFAGALMAEGGMAWRLVNFANIFVGFIRGGLAMVNVLASMFFGGISGSSVADVSSIGSILIPMMKKQGYDDEFSVNITITSGTQGIVIPRKSATVHTHKADHLEGDAAHGQHGAKCHTAGDKTRSKRQITEALLEVINHGMKIDGVLKFG